VGKEIRVEGTGSVLVQPDRAVFRVTVDRDGQSHEDAYRSAVEAAARVDAALAARPAAIDRSDTTSLTVLPLTRWRKGESVRTGWRASRTTTIEVVDLGALGALVADLATAGATLAGPEWRIDDASPAHDEVRELAARDARRRADAYARGLGVAVGKVRWVSEPSLQSTAVPMMRAAGAAQAKFAGEEDAVIDVSPGEVELRASVHVSFALADPSAEPSSDPASAQPPSTA
jgi:uncharacterized protein YggE